MRVDGDHSHLEPPGEDHADAALGAFLLVEEDDAAMGSARAAGAARSRARGAARAVLVGACCPFPFRYSDNIMVNSKSNNSTSVSYARHDSRICIELSNLRLGNGGTKFDKATEVWMGQ